MWERATSEDGLGRLGRALRRFGAAPGAVLGEGGEFETLVLDGPAPLFKKRIVVPEAGRSVVSDGGGSLWLMLRGASLEDKADDGPRGQTPTVREPPLLDARFEAILSSVTAGAEHATAEPGADGRWLALARGPAATLTGAGELLQWSVVADAGVAGRSIEAETALVVDKIRKALSSASRDASQITNTLIVLRRMADFSAVNEEYGKLFARPIPPSRVTVSCGDLLPPGRNVLVFVSMPRAAVARGDRSGLHVQARSYWAPANIGPYSQAVDVPVTARTRATGLRAVYVAGQIPLVPASMTLPPPSCAASLQKQIVLSLQHLWRIGAEMKVQCWTSAVAYFARASPSSSSPAEAMERRARQACRAWALAHAAPDEDEAEAEVGPDPWHLRYNHEYMTLGGADAQSSTVALPDWSIFTMRQQNAPESCIPPVFAAEVQGLPRQSAVEWHAHVGLAHVPDGCAEMMRRPEVGGRRDWSAWHAVVRTAEASLVYTALARRPVDDEPAGSGDLEQALREAYRQSVRDICPEATAISSLDGPCLVYVDVAQAATPWKGAGDWDGQMPFALVPCHSIWSPEAGRLACLALFRADLVAASQ
ncbi:hypothetical protein CDD83_3603 [Cordyceps sp. RAO-2017]|nr:hypothetical protein CDD83_3603 [Cordyceps sp. RAO-2017]